MSSEVARTRGEEGPAARPPSSEKWGRVLMIAGAAYCVTPWSSPQIALGLGVALALLGLGASQKEARRVSRLLIQVCVVLLGFRMNLGDVAAAGLSGVVFAAGTIAGAYALGWALTRALRVDGTIGVLISSGTAICGGSAIAAVGSAIEASAAAMAVATGVVFLLNGAALYLFPALGDWLGLSDLQFGTWAGVAIHDVSSVVGAARHYHADGGGSAAALDTATVVKLSRVLWIVPIAIAAAWVHRTRSAAKATARRIPSPMPWFIALFLIASALRTWFPAISGWAGGIQAVATAGMCVALFLIGTGLSRKALREVGWRPLAMAVVLWIALAAAALLVVRATVA